MSGKFNAASRVHNLLSIAVQQNDNIAMYDAWYRVFDIPNVEPIRKMIEMAVMVGRLLDELERVRQQMRTTSVVATRYNDVIDRIERALDLAAPTNPWGNYKQYLHGYTLETLAIFSDLLGDEISIDDNELAELSQLLQDLETQINQGNLSTAAKDFILRQINIIRNAMRFYRIQGNSAFEEAISQAATSIALNQDVIQDNKGNEEFQAASHLLGRAWGVIQKYSPNVQTILAYYEGGKLLLEGTQTVVRLITGG